MNESNRSGGRPDSRYAHCERRVFLRQDGTQVPYLSRRFLPDGLGEPLLLSATVEMGTRLDTLAAASLGDPTQDWRIADANNALNPRDLTRPIGRILRVPVPRF